MALIIFSAFFIYFLKCGLYGVRRLAAAKVHGRALALKKNQYFCNGQNDDQGLTFDISAWAAAVAAHAVPSARPSMLWIVFLFIL